MQVINIVLVPKDCNKNLEARGDNKMSSDAKQWNNTILFLTVKLVFLITIVGVIRIITRIISNP